MTNSYLWLFFFALLLLSDCLAGSAPQCQNKENSLRVPSHSLRVSLGSEITVRLLPDLIFLYISTSCSWFLTTLDIAFLYSLFSISKPYQCLPSWNKKLFNFDNHTQQMFNKANPGWTRDFQLEAGRWWSWYPGMPRLALGSCSSLVLHASERGGISCRDPQGWWTGRSSEEAHQK